MRWLLRYRCGRILMLRPCASWPRGRVTRPRPAACLALSVIAAGGMRSEAAENGGVELQTVRDWVVTFNTDGPGGLNDGKAPGARPRLNVDQREVLRTLVEQGPTPAAHGVVRWRLYDLAQILCEDHGVSVSEQTLSRVLRAMGYANSRLARAITPRTQTPQLFSERFPRPFGADRAGCRG